MVDLYSVVEQGLQVPEPVERHPAVTQHGFVPADHLVTFSADKEVRKRLWTIRGGDSKDAFQCLFPVVQQLLLCLGDFLLGHLSHNRSFTVMVNEGEVAQLIIIVGVAL